MPVAKSRTVSSPLCPEHGLPTASRDYRQVCKDHQAQFPHTFPCQSCKTCGYLAKQKLDPVLVWVASDVLSEPTAAFEYLRRSC